MIIHAEHNVQRLQCMVKLTLSIFASKLLYFPELLVYRGCAVFYYLFCRLLRELYSYNSEEESRFPSTHLVKPLQLSALLPSVVLWTGSFVVINSFSVGREIYWRFALAASFAGILWAGIRY